MAGPFDHTEEEKVFARGLGIGTLMGMQAEGRQIDPNVLDLAWATLSEREKEMVQEFISYVAEDNTGPAPSGQVH